MAYIILEKLHLQHGGRGFVLKEFKPNPSLIFRNPDSVLWYLKQSFLLSEYQPGHTRKMGVESWRGIKLIDINTYRIVVYRHLNWFSYGWMIFRNISRLLQLVVTAWIWVQCWILTKRMALWMAVTRKWILIVLCRQLSNNRHSMKAYLPSLLLDIASLGLRNVQTSRFPVFFSSGHGDWLVCLIWVTCALEVVHVCLYR